MDNYDDLRGLEPLVLNDMDLGEYVREEHYATDSWKSNRTGERFEVIQGDAVQCLALYETRVPELLTAMDRLEEAYNEKQRCLGSTMEQLASALAENKDLRARCEAMEGDIEKACYTCAHEGLKSCPWEGSYHHRDPNGEVIGVCNGWQGRGPQGQKGDGDV